MLTRSRVKRKRKPSGAEVNRAADIQTRLELLDDQIAKSREITGMDLAGWREHIKTNAQKGLEVQIADFEIDLAARRRAIERIDGLKNPTSSDLAFRDTLQEELELRTDALAEAQIALRGHAAAHAEAGAKKVKRGDKLGALTLLAKHFKLVSDNDGVNALAGALADRLNAAKQRVQLVEEVPYEEIENEPELPAEAAPLTIQPPNLQGADDEQELW